MQIYFNKKLYSKISYNLETYILRGNKLEYFESEKTKTISHFSKIFNSQIFIRFQ